MGFNISGLVINKNYKNDLSALEAILDEKLVLEKEVMFEEACESFKGDGYCDIYFSDKATFVLLAMERGGFEFYADGQEAFSFVLSEMTMTFCVNLSKNGELVRTLIETEDDQTDDFGEPLPIEEKAEDIPGLIYLLFEQTFGQDFFSIEPDSKCYRYTFGDAEEQSHFESGDKKPWWKFW